MKVRSWGVFGLLVLGFVGWGCAGGSDQAAKANVLPFNAPNDSGYRKTIVLGLSHAPQTEIGEQSAGIYVQSIAKSIRKEAPRLRLLTSQEHKPVNWVIDSLQNDPIAVASEKWRRKGYQGVIFADLLDLRFEEKKSGVLWFRKMRYYIYFEATIDLFDPLTGAKMLNDVAEISFKISEKEYQELKSGAVAHIDALDDRLIDLANEFGENAAEALQAQPWQTSIVSVNTEQIMLAAGRISGLQAGDRLAVYRGSRKIEGIGGQFILPGEKVAEIEINSVSDHQAEAKALKSNEIQAGDIAVPLQSKP
jgi:hypothetical protein